MGVPGIRIGDLEAAPMFVDLFPGLDLASVHTRPRERERSAEVAPHRIAREVDEVEIVPPQLTPPSRELGSRILAFGDHRAICHGLEAHLRAGKDTPLGGLAERSDDGVLLPSRANQLDLTWDPAPALTAYGKAAAKHLDGDLV